MIKQLPAILLTIICIVLVVALRSQRMENTRLTERINQMETLHAEPFSGDGELAEGQHPAEALQATNNEEAHSQESVPSSESVNAKESTKRVMRDMAKTIEENPTINKMVEASQRGAIGALYADMIEYLGLDAEETGYFMELLMYRQMANVDAHMKMASGTLSEDEKAALQERIYEINETMRSEMEKFLNDADDFEEFKYYEDTIGERMMLSQMDEKLGDAALSDEHYREVLDVMYDERNNFDWSTDLYDNEIRDLSPERFSTANIQKHIADVKALGELMDKRMQEILTPEQLAAWRESGAAMQALIEGQLMQAHQIYASE